MKNLKVGTKLALVFGSMIILTLLLGGLAIGIMTIVKNSSFILANTYIPEVQISNDMERYALAVIREMDLYTLDDKDETLAAAKKNMSELKRQLAEGFALVSRSPELAHRQGELEKIKSELDEYDKRIADIEAIGKSLRDNRRVMDETAAAYMTSCQAVLAALRQAASEAGDLATNAVWREKQISGVYLLNDIVDLGNTIRVANFKAQIHKDSALLETTLEQFDAIDKKLAEAKSNASIEMEKYGGKIEEIQKEARAYQKAMTTLTDNWAAEVKLHQQQAVIEQQVLTAVRQFAGAGMQNVVKQSGRMVAYNANAVLVLAAGLIVLILIGIVAAATLTRSITSPLLQGVVFARKMAAGDFTQTLAIERRDEIGILAGALNETVASLRRQIQETIKAVNVIASSAGEISTSVAQVAAGSSETATAVSETTSTVEEVKQTSLISSEKARAVSDSAGLAAQASQAGKQSTEAAIEGMSRIRQQMESIAESIMRLSEQSQSIGEIIASVDDIAEQSNLLAVNASIEAAKAGDQGKGFAVVAQEIKSLAGQSKQATEKVRSILNDIQKATGAAVMATEQGSKAVEIGVKQSAQTGEAIGALAGQIQVASQSAIQIAASSQQQLTGIDQVALAMENIKTASHQNVESMEQLKTAARNLQELGGKLKDVVDQFKI